MINSYNILIAHNRGNRPKTFAAALVVFLRMETNIRFQYFDNIYEKLQIAAFLIFETYYLLKKI